MEPFSVLETETRVPLLIWHWQKEGSAGRSWLLQCPAAWEWGALLSCWEDPHAVYGASIGPSSKGGSCGKQHSQYWVLDPTQLPCLKAVEQGSGASAEAVRWGREGGRLQGWRLSVCLVWRKILKKLTSLRYTRPLRLQGTERTESHWLIQSTVLS